MSEPTVSAAPAAQSNGKASVPVLRPAVDIYEVKDGLVVVVDLPGVDKSHVIVELNQDVLTIKGEPKSSLPGTPLHHEYEMAPFSRQFQLNEVVDQDKIHAEMVQGVLTIHLPRIAKRQPRRISVNVAS